MPVTGYAPTDFKFIKPYKAMKTLQFKTNIRCGGCLAQTTPFLNALGGIDKWEVDLKDPGRILTVETDHVTADQVREAVGRAGFKAQSF